MTLTGHRLYIQLELGRRGGLSRRSRGGRGIGGKGARGAPEPRAVARRGRVPVREWGREGMGKDMYAGKGNSSLGWPWVRRPPQRLGYKQALEETLKARQWADEMQQRMADWLAGCVGSSRAWNPNVQNVWPQLWARRLKVEWKEDNSTDYSRFPNEHDWFGLTQIYVS
ncbi:hypothetical protein B0H14DRAFT_3171783 [Mycena olivaceomarginata]|nr:hypothetical protein B0H14DRAFT_3171783 [Mycena olivaceomarginata]